MLCGLGPVSVPLWVASISPSLKLGISSVLKLFTESFICSVVVCGTPIRKQAEPELPWVGLGLWGPFSLFGLQDST